MRLERAVKLQGILLTSLRDRVSWARSCRVTGEEWDEAVRDIISPDLPRWLAQASRSSRPGRGAPTRTRSHTTRRRRGRAGSEYGVGKVARKGHYWAHVTKPWFLSEEAEP